jgi:hypothetical protein
MIIRASLVGRAAAFYLASIALCPGALGAATIAVTTVPAPSSWSDYQIIMWQPKTAQQYARLAEIGVTGAAMIVNRQEPGRIPEDRLESLLAGGLPWYVENIATDFYSAYHRWFPDHPVDWRFEQVKQIYRDNPRDPAAYRRVPSLSDPAWLAKIERRLAIVVRTQRRYRPLFYNLGDETGIADLNAPWDFDFSEASLRGFRRWLQGHYADLAALDREWGGDFRDWGQVTPMTMQTAMARGDGNFSSWSDMKAWMDVAYARALRAGTDAVHGADPTALAGVEGVQLPGWGGYDYARIAEAVDLMEAPPRWFSLLRSLNPSLVLVNTSFGGGPAEERKVWHAFLAGSRGLILWDPRDEFVARDGSEGTRARAAAPYFRALRGGLGALIINSRRKTDAVAILYSQSSMRLEWMLDWRGQGDAWTRQDTDSQNRDNPWRGAMRRYVEALRRIGLTPRFLTAKGIARGALRRGVSMLILPDTLAMSRATATAIRHFVQSGGTVIADREPALFDAHGRRLGEPLLHDLFRGSPSVDAAAGDAILLAPPPDRGPSGKFDRGRLGLLRRLLGAAGVHGEFSIVTASGEPTNDVAVYRWRDGDATILGLERIGTGGVAPAADGEAITIGLPHPAFIYDLRAHQSMGRRGRIDLTLHSAAPKLLALLPTASPVPEIIGPSRLVAGQVAMFRLNVADAGQQAFDVFHVAFTDASGRPISGGSMNAMARKGQATIRVRPGADDPVGRVTLTVNDVMSGRTASEVITMARPR